jgi:uncharacterized protein
MPEELSYPGVYVEEVSASAKPIEGVGTSTAAFAGWSRRGPVDRAELVYSWKDFEMKFGGLDKRSLLGYSVNHFFDNGGRKAYIVRLRAPGSRSEKAKVLRPNEPDFENALLPTDGGGGGLYNLDKVDQFNLLCVPGQTSAATILALQKFCRERRAFLIIDCDQSATYSHLKGGPGNIVGDDSINAAFYFPWLLAADPLQATAPREFPPCGFVAGVYARTDMNRGVWKSPAGTGAALNSVIGVNPDKALNDADNGVLNQKGINCIRTLPPSGVLVWGARTLRGGDNSSEWKYVAMRRFALFIEESIDRGLQWTVFEPNGERLWANIRQSVGDFMYKLFRQGGLMGTTPKEAYFVKCDRETTTQSDIDTGIVNVLVGFAPLKPAEFIIIRIKQLAGPETV